MSLAHSCGNDVSESGEIGKVNSSISKFFAPGSIVAASLKSVDAVVMHGVGASEDVDDSAGAENVNT